MKRTYQRRRKPQPNDKPNKDQTNIEINTNAKTIHKYHRKNHSKSPQKPLTANLSQTTPNKTKQTKHNYNLRTNRITTQNNDWTNSDADSIQSAKEEYLKDHEKKENNKKYKECHDPVSIKANSIETTTSFLSALSLRNSTKKTKNTIKYETELTLDDICNDAVDISEQYFDPESIAYHDFSDDDDTQWPSWVSKDMIKRSEDKEAPSKKRKRIGNTKGSPPSKKLKSPHNTPHKSDTNNVQKKKHIVCSTVRNKKRLRRRSSVANMIATPKVNKGYGHDMQTPIASIRTQRIHRLTRKSNTDLLFFVLLRETEECDELNVIKEQVIKQKRKNGKITHHKLGFKDLNGLQCVGKMDNIQEKLCLHLLSFGADPLWLNNDGISAIYIAMHYTNNCAVIDSMINKCLINNDYDSLNQTYIFASHGTISLLDVALRVGHIKTIKLLLENGLMPTKHSIDYEPKVELITFCKQHRMSKIANNVLKEQLFEAIDNLDVAYVESILCHGIDVNIKVNQSKTSLYYLVQESFDIYDELDAKDQYETILSLLKHGANPNCLDETKTPMLIYPMQRYGRWNVKLVDILLYYGANLKLKVGDTKKNLYLYAKENCVDNEIIKIITNYHNNNKTKNKKKTILNVTANTTLTSMIKTKNVVKKNYKRKIK